MQGEAPEALGADGLDDHAVHGYVADGAEVGERDAKRQELELAGVVTHGQHLVAKGLCVRQHEVAAVGLRVWVDQEQCVPWHAVEPEVGDHVAAKRDEEGVLREVASVWGLSPRRSLAASPKTLARRSRRFVSPIRALVWSLSCILGLLGVAVGLDRGVVAEIGVLGYFLEVQIRLNCPL